MGMYEHKYPIISCDKKLWEEILPILREIKCPIASEAYYPEVHTTLVSNYGNPNDDHLLVGCTSNDKVEYYRYRVNTKEEFINGIYKILGISKDNSGIVLNKHNKLVLNFKL